MFMETISIINKENSIVKEMTIPHKITITELFNILLCHHLAFQRFYLHIYFTKINTFI